MRAETLAGFAALADGALGVDAGLTLTKVARATAGGLELSSHTTGDAATIAAGATVTGLTGARADGLGLVANTVRSQEIEAAAPGALALLLHAGRAPVGDFVLALVGTGTAFATVRIGAEGMKVGHLGGTALGGGSFAGIARRIDGTLTYERMIAGAARGDRRSVDVMISEAYPEGIGQVGPDLTAAHLASPHEGTLDDVLAGLLNLHGENIAQIGASRALIAQIPRIVVAGGFAHNNPTLTRSIASMCGLFGVTVDVVPSPGYAGAVGAALIAAETV
jgi:type II pantothenate kinase